MNEDEIRDRLGRTLASVGGRVPDFQALGELGRRRRRRFRGGLAAVVVLALSGSGVGLVAATRGRDVAHVQSVSPAVSSNRIAPTPETSRDGSAAPSRVAVPPTGAAKVAPPPAVLSSAAPAYVFDDPSTWRVSVSGYGPLRVGMTTQQIRAIVGSTFSSEAGGESGCDVVSSGRFPGVVLQLDDGVFDTTWIGDASKVSGGPSSVSGIHLGMSTTALLAVLGPRATASHDDGGGEAYTDYTLQLTGARAYAIVHGGEVVLYAEGRRAGGEFACI